jgi:uncharacterized protein
LEILLLIIDLDDIKEQGLSLELIEAFDRFPALNELHADGEAIFVQPLDIRLMARKFEGMVIVEGSVTTTVRLQCCRCLQEFEQPLDATFSVTYARELPAMDEGGDDGEVELQADDLGMLAFEGDEIDLTETVQEQVVMALPFKPLCREDCLGLCSQCGADLNDGDCGCRDQVMGGKFAALKDFKIKKSD